MTAENSLSQTSDAKKQKRKKNQQSSDTATTSTQNQNSEVGSIIFLFNTSLLLFALRILFYF